jgi:hypothetical protein
MRPTPRLALKIAFEELHRMVPSYARVDAA